MEGLGRDLGREWPLYNFDFLLAPGLIELLGMIYDLTFGVESLDYI